MRRYETIWQVARFTAHRILLGMVCLSSPVCLVQAAEIYKSIDAHGNVVYSDHLDPAMPQSTEVQLQDPRFPPGLIHFCWTNCFTLALDHGVYRRIDGTDESWTVETFSSNVLVLHRHSAPADWNGHSQDVVYAGQVSNDRLIDVTVNGTPTGGIDASWGSALNTLPGSNAERDAKTTAYSGASSSSGTVSATTAPPSLPAEDQPPLAQDGLLWTPGYWSWRDQRYFWISGAWVRPPQVGALWTPAYWGTAGAVFVFHSGHWGPTVGFYGGVNYGNGYSGNGYTGGHWIGNSFAYNSAVNHVDPAVAHHTYVTPEKGSRGVLSYTTGSRSADSAHTASHDPRPARAASNPVRTTVERAGETTTRTTAEIKEHTDIAKRPAPSTAPKINQLTTTRAAPARQ